MYSNIPRAIRAATVQAMTPLQRRLLNQRRARLVFARIAQYALMLAALGLVASLALRFLGVAFIAAHAWPISIGVDSLFCLALLAWVASEAYLARATQTAHRVWDEDATTH